MKLNTKSLKDVEIGFPVFVEGIYYARIEEAKVEPNKAGDGNNLRVVAKVLDPVLIRNGTGEEIVNKGHFKFTRYISLVESDKYDPNQRLKELALAIKLPEEEDLDSDDLVGKIVKIRLDVREKRKDEKTGKEYPESNDIARFTPLDDDDTFDPGPL